MADVTGPISTLPGASHKVPAGATCDDHPDRPAVFRLQGETDSFGSEMIDLCEECKSKYLAARESGEADNVGLCFCSSTPQPLFPWRDPDEGMSGPVYYKCRPCIRKFNDQARAELEEIELNERVRFYPWYEE